MKHLITQPHIIFSTEKGKMPLHGVISREDAIASLNSLSEQPHEISHPVLGSYGEGHENSIFVSNPNEKQETLARKIAHHTGQESILQSTGTHHHFIYHPDARTKEGDIPMASGEGTKFHENPQEDYFTQMPDGTLFTHNLEFGSKPDEMKKSESLEKAFTPNLKAQDVAPNVVINPKHGKTIADAYEQMQHNPQHPAVKSSYDALIDETGKQYQDLLNQGLKFSRIPKNADNPYPTSKHLHADVDRGHMWYFPTEHGFGNPDDSMPKDHPMLQQTKFKDSQGNSMLANDVFRLVHDSIHHKIRNGFGPKGEHQTFLEHKKYYSPLAQKALATETMGQNNFVNFSDKIGHLNQQKPGSAYAPQKAGLLDENVINGEWHV